MSSAYDAVVAGIGAVPVRESSLRRERRFFTGMAIMLLLASFAGFAPSYYLKSQFGNAPLTPLVHEEAGEVGTVRTDHPASIAPVIEGRVEAAGSVLIAIVHTVRPLRLPHRTAAVLSRPQHHAAE